MPIKRVQFPDGSIKRIQVPDGATDEQILEFAQSQYQPGSSYVVTAPDGAEYEVSAPEGASQEDVLAYTQQHHEQQPWTKYQQQPAAYGPWTKYQQEGTSAQRQPAPGQRLPDVTRQPAGAFDDLIPEQRSKFGGIPVGQPPGRSKLGGVPVDGEARLRQVERALVRADQAGDVQGARTLAAEVRRLRASANAPAGMFDDLIPPSPAGTQLQRSNALAQAQAAPVTDLAPVYAEVDPTDDMSTYERLMAAAGESVVRNWRGLNQRAAEQIGGAIGAMEAGLRAAGARGAADWVHVTSGAAVRNRSQVLRREEAEARRIDAPLNRTTAGKVGLVAGNIAQTVLPGGAAKLAARVPQFARMAPALERVGATLLPRTVAGNATLGAMMGWSQPVVEDSEIATNTAFGGVAGGAGAFVPRVLGAGIRSARGVLEPLTRAGQERVIARTLQRSAVNPAGLQQAAPSAIPGVQRTLAEESLDPGIAQLQRQFPVQLAEQASKNNAARANAVRATFNGADDASIAGIEASRDQAARQALRGLRNAPDVDTAPVKQALDAAIKRHTGNPATQTALRQIAAEMPEIRTPQEAYNFRKYIDFTLSKQSDKPAARQAMRELMTVKSVLDRSMSRSFPQWRSYLGDYKSASRLADQARVGQTLLGAGRQVADAASGERMMTPATMARAANNTTGLVRQATGFNRANPATLLEPGQRGLLAAMADDASRMDFASNAGRATGSNTAQNLATMNAVEQITGGGRLAQLIRGNETVQRVLTPMEKTYGLLGVPDRLQSVLVEALSDPARARVMLDRLPLADRHIIENALVLAGGRLGSAMPASR